VNFPDSLSDLHCAFDGFVEFASVGIPVGDLMHFMKCLLMIATSSEARMLGEYENVGGGRSSAPCIARRSSSSSSPSAHPLAGRLPRGGHQHPHRRRDPPAADVRDGDAGVQVDRVLNGPTNDVWIDPWLEYLRSKGVQYSAETELVRIDCRDHRITGAVVFDRATGLTRTITADYYVAAMPGEVMQTFVHGQLATADPGLTGLGALKTAWMNGIQLYLGRDVPLIPGHSIYLDSPWSVTSISQQQFWKDDVAHCFGDGRVHGILSLDVSDWDTPGIHGKPARECTREEIVSEVWAQLKMHLNLRASRRCWRIRI
jgi:hypothetical protein